MECNCCFRLVCCPRVESGCFRFEFLVGMGNVRGALSLSPSVVGFYCTKLSLAGTVGIRTLKPLQAPSTFNALKPLECIADKQISSVFGFLYLIFNPPSSFFIKSSFVSGSFFLMFYQIGKGSSFRIFG